MSSTDAVAGTPGLWDKALGALAGPVAAAMSIYHLAVAVVGPPITEAHRPIHFMLGAALVFCAGAVPAGRRGPGKVILDAAFLFTVVAPCVYLILNADSVAARMVYVTPLTGAQMVFGILVVLGTLEATRRLLGWPMVILAALFIAYTQIGPHLPYPFWHRGYAPEQVVEQTFLTLDGLWGTPIGASSNYIFLFVLFGALMVASGAGTFFSDFANAVAGRFVGGPAKTAVLSSAMMSMLSGSSTANVVTTGSFTIPAMRAYGYRAEFAAGVEALASTGGLITPPVMGAAAFVMADYLGVSYSEVMYAAVFPAILYFVAIFIAVDLEARRLKLGRERAAGDGVLRTLRQGAFMVVPLGVIVWYLVAGYTPTTAALYGILSFVAAMPLLARRSPMALLRVLWEACLEAPRMMAPVVVACAVGGLVAGIISLTGLGVRLTGIIAGAAGDSTALFLVLTMLVSIVLGMGMPTSAVYIVLASILAPGLIDLGIPALAAHMFIFFGAVMSNITPPLAIASFAAAAVANADPWRTSVVAVRLGVGVFFIPFIFCYSPALIGQGDAVSVAHAFASALLGIGCLSVAVVGWMVTPLRLWARAVLAVAAVALIVPGTASDLIGAAVVAAFVATLAVVRRRNRRDALRRAEANTQ